MNNQASVKLPAVKKKRRKAKSLDRKKARAGWLFVLPFALIFIAVYLPVVFDSIRFSFNEIEMQQFGGYELVYVGLDNYENALFVNTSFVPTLTAGLKQLVFDIPAIVIFSLFIAVLLNDKMVGRTLFRAIFFIPVIIATGIIDSIDQSNAMMDYMGSAEGITSAGAGSVTGADGEEAASASDLISAMDFQYLFRNMKVGQGLVDYVVQIVNDIYNIVNRSGVQMLIFLAGLQSISPAIYESCKIDGASAWETFWKITFPMISPMILVNAIYTVIDSFTSQSNQVMSFIDDVYKNEINGNVISSAMSWMYFLIVIVAIAVVAGLLSMYVFYQRRD